MEYFLLIIALTLLGIFMRRYYITDRGIYIEKVLFGPLIRNRERIKRRLDLFHHIPRNEKHATNEENEIKERPNPKPLPLITPQSTEAKIMYSKAMRHYERGELDLAEKMLIQVTSLDEHFLDAFSRLGIIYLMQKQFGKAEAIFRQLTIQDDTEASYQSNLGRVLYEQKKLDEALKAYTKALEIDGSRAGRYLSAAEIYRELNNKERAQEMYKKAVELDSHNTDYLLTFAHFLIEEKQLNQAKLYLDKVIELSPNNELALEMLAQIG